jgi:hypothetical protein
MKILPTPQLSTPNSSIQAILVQKPISQILINSQKISQMIHTLLQPLFTLPHPFTTASTKLSLQLLSIIISHNIVPPNPTFYAHFAFLVARGGVSYETMYFLAGSHE